MKQILLDTNFLLSCIRNKLDLFEYLEMEGYEVIVPEQVLNEIKKFEKTKSEAKLALKILEKNPYEKKNLSGKTVDKAIINFAKENPRTIIATLDKEIQKSVPNRKMIIRQKKKLEIL